jgi:hypothetical protein
MRKEGENGNGRKVCRRRDKEGIVLTCYSGLGPQEVPVLIVDFVTFVWLEAQRCGVAGTLAVGKLEN